MANEAGHAQAQAGHSLTMSSCGEPPPATLCPMLPDVPLPDLDLSGMRRLDAKLPRAVLDVLVEGLESVDGSIREKFGLVGGDDDNRPGTFSCVVGRTPMTFPVREARDAWRLAADRGLVPASWPDDPRRCFPDQELLFFCNDCDGMGATGYNYDDPCQTCEGRGNEMKRGRVAHPTAIAEVAWMLAHPGLVEQAEAHAREAVRRLGPDSPLSHVERVQWGRVRLGKPLGTVGVIITSPIWDHCRVSDWDWDKMKGPAFRHAPWWPEARKLHELTRQLLCFDVGMAWTHRAMGVPDSPFDPLLRLWELGVMMEELTSDAIILERAHHRYLRSWSSHVPYA